MPIHDILLVCTGVGEFEWKMDSDRSNYMGLVSAIVDEIAGTGHGCRQLKSIITGITNTGIVVNVVDDRSLMELFDSNDPENGFMHLQVEIDLVVPMYPSPDTNQQKRSSGVVLEEPEDDPPTIDGNLLLTPPARRMKMKARRKDIVKGKGKAKGKSHLEDNKRKSHLEDNNGKDNKGKNNKGKDNKGKSHLEDNKRRSKRLNAPHARFEMELETPPESDDPEWNEIRSSSDSSDDKKGKDKKGKNNKGKDNKGKIHLEDNKRRSKRLNAPHARSEMELETLPEFDDPEWNEIRSSNDSSDDNKGKSHLEDNKRRSSKRVNAPHVRSEMELETPSDSDDPEWNEIRSSSDSSESFGSFVEEEKNEENESAFKWSTAKEDNINGGKRRFGKQSDGVKDPNGNIPRAPHWLNGRGRVQLFSFQVFEDNRQLSNVLADYAVENGFELKKVKAESVRVTAECATPKCSWRVHASTTVDRTTFMIKTLNDKHTCQVVKRNRVVTTAWIARKLKDEFKLNPNLSIKAMRSLINAKWGVEVPSWKLHRARLRLRGNDLVDHSKEFSRLRWYGNMILKTNPRSDAIVMSNVVGRQKDQHAVIDEDVRDNDQPIFKRMYICYEACRVAFYNGLRPFIGFDGCHLKGPFGGILLATVALDANLQMVPIAVAIVEIENTETWSWFIMNLKNSIGNELDTKPWSCMSDRQKGLVEAIANLLPMCTHRTCAYHVWKNFQRKHGDIGLRNLYWAAAEATNVIKFSQAMQRIKDMKKEAYDWLAQLDPRQWSHHAMDPRVKSEHITNNFIESFNSWLDELRFKAPIKLLDGIRSKLMELIFFRKSTADRWNRELTPRVQYKVNKLLERGRYAEVKRCWEYEFEVAFGEDVVEVKLDEWTCTCGAWQLTGIPCVHGMACINFVRAKVEDYVHPYFKTDTWKKTFVGMIHVISSPNNWPIFPAEELLQPPQVKRLPGRPSVHRRREPGEVGPKLVQSATKKCSRCGNFGHNLRSCTGEAVKKTKRQGGRPVDHQAALRNKTWHLVRGRGGGWGRRGRGGRGGSCSQP